MLVLIYKNNLDHLLNIYALLRADTECKITAFSAN